MAIIERHERFSRIEILEAQLDELEKQLSARETELAEQKALAQIEFNKLHAEGYQRFGRGWLDMNAITSALNSQEYLPKYDVRVNTLLSKAALTFLENYGLPITYAEMGEITAIEKASKEYEYLASSEVEKLLTVLKKLKKAK